jgi:uncharacterized membrane protein
MENESKLPQSIVGALMGWFFAVMAWTASHVGVICGFFAVAASIYSIRASRETIKLQRKRQNQLKDNYDADTKSMD